MHDPLGNAFAVEVGMFLEQLPVLHQQRPARTGCQAVLVVGNGNAGGGGELGHEEAPSQVRSVLN
jgi:hypothetical protein